MDLSSNVLSACLLIWSHCKLGISGIESDGQSNFFLAPKWLICHFCDILTCNFPPAGYMKISILFYLLRKYKRLLKCIVISKIQMLAELPECWIMYTNLRVKYELCLTIHANKQFGFWKRLIPWHSGSILIVEFRVTALPSSKTRIIGVFTWKSRLRLVCKWHINRR